MDSVVDRLVMDDVDPTESPESRGQTQGGIVRDIESGGVVFDDGGFDDSFCRRPPKWSVKQMWKRVRKQNPLIIHHLSIMVTYLGNPPTVGTGLMASHKCFHVAPFCRMYTYVQEKLMSELKERGWLAE